MNQKNASSLPASGSRLASKAARHQLIADLLSRNVVSSQASLSGLLAEAGFEVTQATLSRDLDELGAFKTQGDSGTVYVIPEDGTGILHIPGSEASNLHKLQRMVHELMTSAEGSANLAVLRTPPGAAQFLASTIDHALLPEILGCIAGDDTIMLVSRSPEGGQALADEFVAMSARKS